MKEERMLKLIGQIDNEYIMEAVPGKKAAKKNVWLKWSAAAACLCLIAITAFMVFNWRTPAGDSYVDAGEGDALLDGDPNGYDPLPGGQLADNTEVSQQIPETLAPRTEYDTSPVYYSSLAFADGELNEEVLAFSESSMMDVKAFDEATLSQDHCYKIIEGTVVNLYVKHYTYDIYSDKFEKNGIMHSRTDTIVYEIAVDRTWYGEDISGDTILIEDTSYFTEPILAVKVGRRYVLPLYEYGESIWTLGHEYAGGDITRESRYSTIYPYHPQIAVTDDGSYLIPKDWSTLTAVNARDVIMDTLDEEYSYYQDKMCLVDADTFASQMSVLVSRIKYHDRYR